MATFLKTAVRGRRDVTKPLANGTDVARPPPVARPTPVANSTTPLSGGPLNVGPPQLFEKTKREEKEENNQTEYEYMRSMFADLMTTMPVTPVARRPGRAGTQPQGSDACRLIIAANNASLAFSKSFNQGNAAGCGAAYMTGALMEARPQGIILGRKLIESFWNNILAGNPGPIRYSNVRMRVLDEDTVTMASDWTFNTMRGVLLLETWRRQLDGSFELEEERFKIEEVYQTPKVVSPEEEVLGLQHLHVINEVMEALATRIDMFTNGDVDGFINSYTPDALQTVDPLANSKGRDNIRKVAGFYIENRKNWGNGRLTYNNFKVKVIDTRTVHVSGDWDLGGRGNEGCLFGYMNVQRYVKQPNGKWLLEIDDWTVEPTDFLY